MAAGLAVTLPVLLLSCWREADLQPLSGTPGTVPRARVAGGRVTSLAPSQAGPRHPASPNHAVSRGNE